MSLVMVTVWSWCALSVKLLCIKLGGYVHIVPWLWLSGGWCLWCCVYAYDGSPRLCACLHLNATSVSAMHILLTQ